MLITFEGIEGSGKSTQVELLYQYLTGKGYEVVKTREPGGTVFGEALRKIFLQTSMPASPLSELLVFMAIRAQHVEEIITPALEKGKIIICDRFTDASYAYQGYGRGMDMKVIAMLNKLVTKGIEPELTILLNCKVDTGFKRKVALGESMDRFEKEALTFHKKIRNAYIKISKENPGRFFVINGGKKKEDIHRAITKKVEKLLKNHGI